MLRADQLCELTLERRDLWAEDEPAAIENAGDGLVELAPQVPRDATEVVEWDRWRRRHGRESTAWHTAAVPAP